MSSSANVSETPKTIFHLSPIIRLTLVALYFALTFPLPFLAKVSSAPIPPWLLGIGIAGGAIALVAVLSERVIVDDETIQIAYPQWVLPGFRKGWSLQWTEIQDLKLRTTGQGGLVYYFVSRDRDRAYLLPARVAGFARLLKRVEEKTGIDTRDIRPLAQPWMYLILLGLTLLLLLVDGWAVATAIAFLER